MGDYLNVAIELVCGLGILFVILKFLGKTQFSQLTPFDFISALILGNWLEMPSMIMKSRLKKLFLLRFYGACLSFN